MSMISNAIISNGIAVLPGPRITFLDHLMPLCDLWKIPLICTDEWVYACAHAFYPPTELLFAGHSNFQHILSNYQTFVSVEPCRLHPHALMFGEFLYQGEGKTVAGFHGNPTKFRHTYWIERYANEDTLLVYGEYLMDYLKEKNVLSRLKNVQIMGNFRKAYYERHKLFFDKITKPHLFPHNHKKTLLWASTWTYPKWRDSFSILKKIPAHYQIIVKLHPFMFRLFPQQVAFLKEEYRSSDSVLFLDEIPIMYPLLAEVDLYLGDDSSIAYDFLAFNRPLFFVEGPDVEWGTKIDQIDNLFSFLDQPDQLCAKRKAAYRYIFEDKVG